MILLLKQKETLRKQTYGCWGVGKVRDFGMDMYTPLYLKQISNKDQDYSTGNSAQCYAPGWMGVGFGWESVSQFSRSVMSDSATPWSAACQASLSTTNSQSLLKIMSIKSVMPSSHLILCRPLLLLPSIFPNIRVFSKESALHIRWPKYWNFSFNISPSNKYSGLVSFRMDWLDQISLQSKGLSRVFSNTTAQKHQLFGAQLSLWLSSHIHTWLLEKL